MVTDRCQARSPPAGRVEPQPDRRTAFRFDRTFTMQGEDSKASYELTTDGKPVEETAADVKSSSRMYWEGDILVLSQRFEKAGLPEATNVVHYRLLEGGRVLEAVERVTGPRAHENVWIFEKAPVAPVK